MSGSEQPLKVGAQSVAFGDSKLHPKIDRHSDMSGDEASSARNRQPQANQPAPHEYPPRSGDASRRGSSYSYTHHLDDVHSIDQSSGNATPLPRSASTPAVPYLREEDSGAVDMDVYDKEDLNVIAELARGGKPDLDAILDGEIEKSQGSVIVGCCGPTALNNLVRGMVAKRISPSRIAKGDSRGNLELIVEDFTS